MQLRPEIQITSMINAMTETVIPAVDPNNHLAVEQSQLVLGMLRLMAQQMPLQFRFDRDELARLVATSDKLSGICGTDMAAKEAAQEMTARGRASAELLEACRVDPAELWDAIRGLRQALGEVAAAMGTHSKDADRRAKTEACILEMTRDQLLRDRALLLSQGWELNPGSLPPIEDLLDQSETGG